MGKEKASQKILAVIFRPAVRAARRRQLVCGKGALMDFKAQIIEDLKTFHNSGEFAEMMCIWYDGKRYEVPAVLDHLTGTDRRQSGGDNAEGIYRAEAMLYLSYADMGIVPQKGHEIEIEQAGAINYYMIEKSSYEDGEIVLELGAFTE